jgi:ADP-heptose:LPS heptosyltransferase
MKTKVLIIRFSSIGDIVLTTPVVRCLKEQLEGGAEVHFITKNKFKSVLSANPYLSKVYGIDKSVDEVLPELKAEDYDYVVDLHNNIRSGKIKRSLDGLNFTFSKLNWQKWLLVNFKVNKMPNKHIVDRYLDCVSPLGIENDGKGLDYFLEANDNVTISEALPIEFHQEYVGFVIGGTYATKKLPTDKIVEYCNSAKLPIVLLGGPEDVATGNLIIKKTTGTVFNACGKFKLNQSASLVKQAKQIITHDTGLMHIAAAFKKEIISVWGNTVPEFGMYPYLPNEKSKMVQVNIGCRPCSKLGYDKCPKGHFKCMQEINLS